MTTDTLRQITGALRTPEGSAFPNKTLTWFRERRVVQAQGSSVVLDEPFYVVTDAAGAIDHDVMAGNYLVLVRLKDTDRYFRVSVPDQAGPFNIADLVDAPPVTPEIITQVQALVIEARAWAQNPEGAEPNPDTYPGEFSARHWSEKSRKWAETPENTEVATGQFSSLHHAAKAAASAGQAALYDGPWLDDVSALLADTALTYTAAQPGTVSSGDYVRTRAEGFSYEVAASAATDNHVTTAGGVKLYRVTQQTLEMTVGSGGDFATVNAAITFLDGQRRTYGSGATATVRLLTGFVMAEQVMCRDGVDLSWITIVSDDPVVTVIGSAITQTEKDTSTRRPVISAVRNASAPVLGCVLSVDTSSSNDTFGLYAQSGGTVTVAPASGVINADFNCYSWAGRVVTLLPEVGNYWDEENRPKFTGGKKGALSAWNGSYVSAVGWDMDGSFQPVICGGGSYMDAQRSRARNSTGDWAYLSRDASVLNARTSDASGAAGNGYIVFHAGFLNARHFDDTGSQCANNCGAWGFSALSGGIIEAEDATALNCGAGSVKAEDGGQVSVRGLRGESGTSHGVFALKGGRITAENAVITGGSSNCIRAERAGWVSAPFSTLTAVGSAVFAHLNGEIDVSNSSITSTGDNALFCQEGGRITGYQITARASVSSILCRRGAYVVATAGDLRKNGTSEQASDVSISGGAIVQMNGSQGGVNVTVNTISASGIVFK